MESVCTGTRGLDVECWLSIRHSPTPSRWYRGHAKPGDCQMVLTSSPGLCSSCRRNWHSDTVYNSTLCHEKLQMFVQFLSGPAPCLSGTTGLRNVNFFTQTKIWVQNLTQKTRTSRLICFRDKTRKSWSIQVIVGLVCYVHCPSGYLVRIWVECKCAIMVEITPLKYRI